MSNKSHPQSQFSFIPLLQNAQQSHRHLISDFHRCQWGTACNQLFADPQDLFDHVNLCHIGRKSQGNLCLKCEWLDETGQPCNVQVKKRDHITSHVRVHLPLKPFVCQVSILILPQNRITYFFAPKLTSRFLSFQQVCTKAFKRAQDYRKHMKLHSGDGEVKTEGQNLFSHHGHPGINYLPTPTPPVTHQITPSYIMPSPDTSRNMAEQNGNKRKHEPLNDFLLDVKRKRVEPVYNDHMSHRLAEIAAAVDDFDSHFQRQLFTTQQDLLQVNQFLSTLCVALDPNMSPTSPPLDSNGSHQNSSVTYIPSPNPSLNGFEQEDRFSSVPVVDIIPTPVDEIPSPFNSPTQSHPSTSAHGHSNIYASCPPSYVNNQTMPVAQVPSVPRPPPPTVRPIVPQNLYVNTQPQLMNQPPLHCHPRQPHPPLYLNMAPQVTSRYHYLTGSSAESPDSSKPSKPNSTFKIQKFDIQKPKLPPRTSSAKKPPTPPGSVGDPTSPTEIVEPLSDLSISKDKNNQEDARLQHLRVIQKLMSKLEQISAAC
ncbi:hypothetical protein BKA69DRAFT_1047338 [Paraphysoderma sedebokerense]|nr:hypothetical protein BKA69DRAFT_1047338 [Paraphysoderma sedebokerense]